MAWAGRAAAGLFAAHASAGAWSNGQAARRSAPATRRRAASNAPAAGLQVPAGTVRDGESPAAALREAEEETGLAGLVLVASLGERVWDPADVGRAEVHHRFFFHLRRPGAPPARWRHWEADQSDAPGARHLFECFWARLPDGVPDLVADHGALLPRLVARLAGQTGTERPGATKRPARCRKPREGSPPASR
jgi:8-oxo-dGTP diphosphatase